MTDLSGRPYDILTFGDLCVDLILTGEDVRPQFGQVEKLIDDYLVEMGGSTSIFACQAARLGLRTAIAGRVGEDLFGQLVLRRLQESGVDIRHVKVDASLKTGLGIALCQRDDRAILTFSGSICALGPEDVSDELLRSARHLHHGSLYLQTGLLDHMPDIFARAKQFGLSTSLDTNWDPHERWNSTLNELLPLTDVFMPNEQEARKITHSNDLNVAISKLLENGIKLVALKRGENGARLYAGESRYECTVEPASGGDSIGAGDSFDAGFLAGWLRGMPLQRCLDIGCVCGRSVAGAYGGLSGQPKWPEIMVEDPPN